MNCRGYQLHVLLQGVDHLVLFGDSVVKLAKIFPNLRVIPQDCCYFVRESSPKTIDTLRRLPRSGPGGGGAIVSFDATVAHSFKRPFAVMDFHHFA